MRLTTKQFAFFRSQETFAALVGGIGAGKSQALVMWSIVRRLSFPGSLGLMVGPTLVNLKATTLRKYFELLEPIRDQVVARWNISDRLLTFKNGSQQLFWGADDEGVIQRMRGLEIADFELDEAALMSGAVMDVLPGRMRQRNAAGEPYPYRARMATTHNGEDWLYQKFGCDGTGPTIGTVIHTSIYENRHLPPEYVKTVEMLFTDTEYAKQELLGGHAKFSGLMYPGFDTTTHIIDTLPHFKRLVLGFDWGFHFAPVIAVGVTDDDQVVVAKEWYGQRVTLDQQADGALSLISELGFHPNDVDGFADPSRPENRMTVQQRTGIGFPPYEAGHITEGVLEVARLLRRREDGKPGLVVHRSCVWMIKELRSYQRKERPGRSQNDPTRFSDEPAPGQLDHACLVAGTMIATPDGERSIESVHVGDLVLTRDGPHRVVAAGMTDPAARVLTLVTNVGTVLTGTANHPIYVAGRGFVRLDALRYGDRLVTWSGRYAGNESPTSSTSHSAGSSSDATQTRPSTPRGRTSFPAGRTALRAWADFTKRYGRPRMAPSPTVGTSITWTATHSTTTSQTSPASPRTSTHVPTPRSIVRAAGHPSDDCGTSRPSARSRWLGTEAPPVGAGTVVTRSSPTARASHFLARVTSVVADSTRSAVATTTDSARTSVSRRGVARPASTTSRDLAPGAGSPSPSTSTPSSGSVPVRVLAVTSRSASAPVYNLSVEGSPEYFANGILTHNCDALRYTVRGLSQAGPASNAIAFLNATNPACAGCGRRFYFPLNKPKMNCPHCGREAIR